jgi:acyl carrier protein
MSVMTDLQEFILEEITTGRAVIAIGPDDDLLARGIIDSLGVTQLVDFVCDRYGVTVDAGDLVPDNFHNVRAIEALIARKRPAPC